MNDLRQAAKQALEALELSSITVDSFKVQQAAQDSISVLRAQLEQPEQRKPLTWEQISQIGLECANDKSRLPFEVKLARAIEQAHGIKGEA